MFAFVACRRWVSKVFIHHAVLFSVTLPHKSVLNRADLGRSQLFLLWIGAGGTAWDPLGSILAFASVPSELRHLLAQLRVRGSARGELFSESCPTCPSDPGGPRTSPPSLRLDSWGRSPPLCAFPPVCPSPSSVGLTARLCGHLPCVTPLPQCPGLGHCLPPRLLSARRILWMSPLPLLSFCHGFWVFCFCFFLSVPRSMHDLSSLTSDRTCSPCGAAS